MELPNLGTHCSEATCNRLDFLPVKCDGCQKQFCMDHMKYAQHACPNAQDKDVQVPVCPLCNAPVPSPKNQPPDIAVGAHIDQDCQSTTAKSKRKKRLLACRADGCKAKEIIPVVCSECSLNFCLRHRFPDQHKCQGKRAKAAEAAQKRLHATQVPSYTSKVQGNMSEDEALARALAESMREERRPQGVRAGGSSRSDSQCHVS